MDNAACFSADRRWAFPKAHITNIAIESATSGSPDRAWSALCSHARFQEFQSIALQGLLQKAIDINTSMRASLNVGSVINADSLRTDLELWRDALASLDLVLRVKSGLSETSPASCLDSFMRGGSTVAINELFQAYLAGWYASDPCGKYFLGVYAAAQTIVGKIVKAGLVEFEGDAALFNDSAAVATDMNDAVAMGDWERVQARVTMMSEILNWYRGTLAHGADWWSRLPGGSGDHGL